MVTVLNYLKAWLKQIVCGERKKLESPTRKIAIFPIILMNAVLHAPPQKSQLTLNTTKTRKKILLETAVMGSLCGAQASHGQRIFVLNERPFPEGHGWRTGPKVTDTRDNSYPTFSLFSVVLGIQILTVFTVSYPTIPHNHRNVHKCWHFLDYNGCSGIGRFFIPSRKAKITNYFNFQLSVTDWFISEKPCFLDYKEIGFLVNRRGVQKSLLRRKGLSKIIPTRCCVPRWLFIASELPTLVE